MNRSRGVLLLSLLAVCAAFTPPGAAASTPTGRPPSILLEQGSRGPRVAALQWLLGGHRPSVYRGVATFPAKPTGIFGSRTAAAVVEMKRRLGFPDRALRPVAGDDLVSILEGKQARPLGYLIRATRRLAAAKAIAAEQASTACARRLIAIERAQLGAHEQPWGSNWGPKVREYLSATGLGFPAPWCAAFQAWAYRLARVGFPNAWDGYIAATKSDQAGVFAIVRNAQRRGWERARPKPGYLAAFVDRLGHITLVERVAKSGIWTLEGNASDAVRERFHPFGVRPVVFIAIPGCQGG